MTTQPVDWQTVHADFQRDHNGWPKIIPRGGGKAVPYRRMTSFVGELEDHYRLDLWRKRQVAKGIAQRDDLRLSVLAHLDEDRLLDDACKAATEYAKAGAAATTGTAFHSLTDLIDRGHDLPAGLPANIVKTLEAFRAATDQLKIVSIEPKTVLDTYQCAGTPDRIYELPDGTRVIGDTKTGNIKWGTLKIAQQLAGYSRSWLYDVATGERTPHACSTNWGIVMDVDLEACTVDLRRIDLETGWHAFLVSKQVWDIRKLDKYDVLTVPYAVGDEIPRDSLRLEVRDGERAAEITRGQIDQVARMIRASTSRRQVLSVWEAHAAIWTDELTDIGREHMATLPEDS